MPNWCSNRLVIEGEEHALTSLLSAAKTDETDFSFNGLVPMPEELKSIRTGGAEIDGVHVTAWREVPQEDGTIVKVPLTAEYKAELLQKYGSDNWYDWSIENWGTKWDASEARVDVDGSEDVAEIDFETAWGPPSEFVKTLAAKFPMFRITLMYAEPGMCFGGTRVYDKGELVDAFETSSNSATAALSEWHELVVGICDEDETCEDEDEDEDKTQEEE